MRAAPFDVDGTLVDTNYLHAVTWWEAFAQAGHVVPMAEIHRAIGMGSGLMLDKLLPQDRDKGDDADIRTAHSAPVGGLATAQHQDNQDDDHNEDDGADADIH